ncbi:MAG: phage protease, partial [Candidatus Brocadiaceae bacterium]
MSTKSTAEAGVQAVALPLVTRQREGEGSVPGRIMLARVGTWLGHPTMPEVVEREHLRSALEYFSRHHAAHGADLVIDYHHASVVAPAGGTTAPAAGWVRAMELRADGAELWGEALWTTEAAAAIAARRYRYLSPVFRFNAPDRVTGEAVPMYIHSVALTNTPFLTELESLNEASAMDGGGEPSASEGGERMSLLDGLAEALGREPQDVAPRLGVQADADQKEIAEVVLANANAAAEPTRGAGRPEPVVSPT